MPENGITSTNEELAAGDTGTNALLKQILTELKNIGGKLREQDDRLDELERKRYSRSGDNLEDVKYNSRPIGPAATPWSAVLEEIKLPRAWPNRLTIADAIHIYQNDLVGIDQLAKDEKRNAFATEPSPSEVKEWTRLVGHIWRVPHDGRLALRFQKRWLLRPDQNPMRLPSDPLPAGMYLRRLAADELLVPLPEVYRLPSALATSHLSIADYFDQDVGIRYDLTADTTKPFSSDLFTPQSMPDSPQNSPMCTSGPWRRIICVRGMEYRTLPLLRGPLPNHINMALKNYSNCSRRYRDRRWVEWDADCQRFHVTYYNIQLARSTGGVHPWKHGPLHSGRPNQILCESAYTALLIPQVERKESSRDYWTLLDLRSDFFPAPHPNVISTLSGRIDVVQATMIVADSALKTIKSHWTYILEYFDSLMSETDTFLDPDRHDDLLSDDTSFSRSKKYFWAITALKELDVSISDTLLQIKRLLETKSTDWVESSRSAALEDARSCLRIRYQEIEEIALKLREKRQEAVDLRDGLFSASAVIESRVATRLGENVKLLTFVSIFFLPLSFCMALWSINTLFSLNSLAIVTTLVALSTYFTVFNLDSVVLLFKETHNAIFSLVIKRMKKDQDHMWRERGKAFEKFSSPRRAEYKPSDWRLLQYMIQRIFRASRGIGNDMAGDEAKLDDNEFDIRKERSFKLWTRQSKISSSTMSS